MKLVSQSIEDIENKFGDIAYIHVTSVGNAASTGDREFTKNFDTLGMGIGYKPVAIVGVKADAKFPFAVAEYNEKTNTIGNIIGWFKDEDVYAKFENYSNVIEMPISKYLTYGNICDFDLDKDGNIINTAYMPPLNYVGIEENNRHGIKIDYTEQEKDGYYVDKYNGLYVSKNMDSIRAKLDENNLKLIKKFKIKNRY